MRRIFLTVLLLSSLVSSFLFAVDMKKENGDFKKDRGAPCHMKKSERKKPVHFSLMRYLHELDLTKEQVSQVKEIMHNTKPKMESLSEVFKDGKFDKSRYIDISLNKHKNMVEYRATLIEKIYNILTIEQKKELKNMIDSKKFDDKRGLKHDKHSNGGR
jgi:Spy/CpxP family protein refolding chaperone